MTLRITETRPKFRPDIKTFHRQKGSGDGLVLHDPLAAKYFQISEYEFDLVKNLDGKRSVAEIINDLNLAGKYYSDADATAVVTKADQMGLLLGLNFTSAGYLKRVKEKYAKASRFKPLSSIYFLFIPILNPDAFLDRTLRLFNILAHRWVLISLACALPGAAYIIISELPRVNLEYLFFFNWQNLLFLWITIALTKLVHEFAHAYTAKKFGLSVPEMGIAFLVFFPCLYCNTTDAWQLADSRRRMLISAAGILAEGAVATVATYVWYFSQPGLVQSLAFYLMTVSFISTILFNANPLMRFDGYFLLVDIIGMPNLAANSLRHLKYMFMNRVLGDESFSTPAKSAEQAATYIIYGVCAFIYRIFLYVSLSIGVYYRFDKTLGILLAALAVALFIFRPLVGGLRTIFSVKSRIKPRKMGSIIFVALSIAGLVSACLPWSSKTVYPCYISSRKIQKIAVPLLTQVDEVFIRDGAAVKKGALLLQLDTTKLSVKLRGLQLRREAMEKELQLMLLDEKFMSKTESKAIEMLQVEDEIRKLKQEFLLAKDNMTAPFDGVINALDYRLQRGFQPGEGVVVGEIHSLELCTIHVLVPATEITKIQAGQEARFRFPVRGGLVFDHKIDSVKSYNESDLRNSPFSSRAGGELATEVRGEKTMDVPLEAQYDCSANIVNTFGLPLGMTGRAAVSSPPASLVSRIITRMAHVFHRESFI